MLVVLSPLIVFGLVVLVHELGHFLAMRMVGVYAPRFSIGFGRPILRKRVGETEYVLGWLPLGGYVRWASRDEDPAAMLEGGTEVSAAKGGDPQRKDWDPEAMMPFGPKPVPEHRWFESKPLWARLFILIAGVLMNILLTYGVLATTFAVSGRGDPRPVVDSLIAGGPAARAGIRVGDSVMAIDRVPITAWRDIPKELASAGPRQVTVEVMRDGQRVSIPVVAEIMSGSQGDSPSPRIGVYPRADRLGIGAALGAAGATTVAMGSEVIKSIGGLVTGRIPLSELGGPARIAKESVNAARSGAGVLFQLIAILSINVAMLNLIPLPILDGGQILIQIAERVRGAAFSLRTRERIAQFGLLAMALLFAVVMFNDRGIFADIFR